VILLNKPMLFHAVALALAAGALVAAPAGAKPAHGKKAAHRTTPAKKYPAAVSPGVPDVGQWKPDADLLAQLQPERSFGAFRLRLPVDYTVEEQDMSTPKSRITGYLAKGPTRTDGSFPVMIIFVGVAAPGLSTGSADGLLNGNQAINGMPGLVKTNMQDGEANGLQLVRQYFKYLLRPGSSRLEHGFQYATTDGQTDAIVAALDPEPYNDTTLPLAEAAALTLHRAP
jgi:hypothetical protein